MSSLACKASSPSLLPSRSGGILGIGCFAVRFAIAISLGLYVRLFVFRDISRVTIPTVVPRRNRGAVLGFHVHFGMYPEHGDLWTRPQK